MKIRVNTLYILSVLMALAVSTSSCNDSRTYDHYEAVSLAGWERNDTAKFEIPRQRAGNYILDLGIRASRDYPYRNISLLLEGTVYPKNKKIANKTFTDTIACKIIGDNGNLSGKDGISNTELLRYVTTISLKDSDSIHIDVRHVMSREKLPGISDIGIRLRKEQ